MELILQNSLPVTRQELFRDLPRLKLCTLKVTSKTLPSSFALTFLQTATDPLLICSGPTAHDEASPQEGATLTAQSNVLVAGRTVSTYPHLPGYSRLFASSSHIPAGKQRREGYPTCDSYLAQVQKDGVVVVCVTDGCGWGVRSREASVKAKVCFFLMLCCCCELAFKRLLLWITCVATHTLSETFTRARRFS